MTAAVRVLRQHGVRYGEHLYEYEERGGTRKSSEALGVPEHSVIKTLVMQDDAGQPLVVRCMAIARSRRRAWRVSSVVGPSSPVVPRSRPSTPAIWSVAPRRSVCAARCQFTSRSPVLQLPLVYINGGKRGFCLADPAELLRVLSPRLCRWRRAKRPSVPTVVAGGLTRAA